MPGFASRAADAFDVPLWKRPLCTHVCTVRTSVWDAQHPDSGLLP